MGPLRGIRILDMTSVLMGPFATTILGDLGADIIKLESLSGDTIRQIGPSRSGAMGGLFLHANRSKRSISVDLKRPEGRQVALDLAAGVDVLFYNIRPASMERLGLSYEAVRERRPDILYVGAFGYGQGGAYEADPAYDDLVQGLAAVPSLIAEASGGVPRYVPVNIADRMVGLYAGNAILAGLLHRGATGEGQRIDVPMFETMASVVLGDHLGGRSYVPPLDNGGYGRLLSTSRAPFATSDGHVCLLLYTERNRRDFAALLDGMGGAEMAEAAATIRSAKPGQGINAAIAGVMPARPTAEWLRLLGETDIPHKPLHTIESLLGDRHLADVGFFSRDTHPSEGEVVTMKVPSGWSATPPEPSRPAPLLGEHSREILREIAMEEGQIEALIAGGVVGEPAAMEKAAE
ncbi:CaiB/BaiF CoA transferase family protein [Pseudoroseicyclus tamaricis]|uniref:CoA transferase n=1 Tax=Pseudoroseicyclus tamaricis TaxID=2705421 RepID=A0A6B2JQI8_9RHOB|nr:CoA transferase [Pseudoroseicyclus tamaricis]NDV00235.1 CoA transferase [Pseudoroseicyclus tamaricis]